jgi:two-component system, OmpR family, sensor histidine kinase CssS
MKKSIKSRIIYSYMLLITASFLLVCILVTLSARASAEKQAYVSIQKDAKVISDFLGQITRNDAEATEKSLAQYVREKFKANGNIFGRNWGVITRNYKVLFPRAGEQADNLNKNIIPQVKNKLSFAVKMPRIKISSEGVEYLAAIQPVSEGVFKRLNAVVIVYTPVEPAMQVVSGVVRVLVFSLLVTAILAVIFGIIMARSIANPVIMLKRRAEMLSKRDFDSRVDIKTGDELEELANTIDRMAFELKEYDIAQKRFLQNASHELKTPLMSIQGYAEGIKDGVFENNDQALEVIVEESTRLKGIVEELIYLSKLETMEDFYSFNSVGINGIIEKSVEKVNSLAVKKGIRINTMLYKDAISSIDSDKLTQAFINILGNCLRHAKSEVNIVTSNDGNWFEVSINDDGDGFEEKDLKKVFERFHKGSKGDTGLGMAITQIIINRHNGTIDVANRTEGGAEFKIRLPLKQQEV